MANILHIGSGAELGKIAGFCGVSALAGAEYLRHSPELHLALVDGEKLLARCSIWWEKVAQYPGHRLGVIGHYAAMDLESGNMILKEACEVLREMGRTFVVGPMDGNTWRRYRLVTDRGTEPMFFMEPENPREWVSHFTVAGFEPIAQYTSALCEDLGKEDARALEIEERMQRMGVVIRGIQMGDFERDLHGIYELSLKSFSRNFLYTPISEAEFSEMYEKAKGVIKPELALLAEHEGRLVGFVFAIPDVLRAQRDTVVVKTLAIEPQRRYAGLGAVLLNQCHSAAVKMGFTRAIHALMHESNKSQTLSGRSAKTIRRYALFGRAL